MKIALLYTTHLQSTKVRDVRVIDLIYSMKSLKSHSISIHKRHLANYIPKFMYSKFVYIAHAQATVNFTVIKILQHTVDKGAHFLSLDAKCSVVFYAGLVQLCYNNERLSNQI